MIILNIFKNINVYKNDILFNKPLENIYYIKKKDE